MNQKGLKIILILGAIFFIALVFTKKETSLKEVRVRILANSNSTEDQAEKYYLKNLLVPILEKHCQEKSDPIPISLIKNELLTHIEDEELKRKIKVEYSRCSYAAQSYQEQFLPAGEYQTLLITIGSGKGQNWWTVLYPEFFGIAFEDEDHNITYRSYFYDKFNKK